MGGAKVIACILLLALLCEEVVYVKLSEQDTCNGDVAEVSRKAGVLN